MVRIKGIPRRSETPAGKLVMTERLQLGCGIFIRKKQDNYDNEKKQRAVHIAENFACGHVELPPFLYS